MRTKENCDIKVCHISTLHKADDTRIYYKECQSLYNAGYEVYYIASNCEEKRINGVSIIPTLKTKNRLERFALLPFDVLIKSLRINCRVYHFHDPELIFVGLILKLFKKIVIYDVHEDIFLQIYNKLWIPKYMRKYFAIISRTIERLATKIIDHTVVSTPAIKKRFFQDNVTIIQNFPIVKNTISNINFNYNSREKLIVYIGSISEKRGIFEMIDIIGALNKRLFCKLAIAGDFNDKKLQQKVMALTSWQRHIEFFGWLGRNEIIRLLNRARIGLTLLHPCPNYLESYPVKLFEYMCAGIPVIASNFDLWEKIIKDAKCGYTFNPFDINKIVNALDWVLNNQEDAYKIGRNGRQYIEKHYNWENEAKSLLGIYSSLPIS